MGGTLNFSAQGGTGLYNYELTGTSGNITSDDGFFDQLIYGPHEVSVTDENNCEAKMDILVTLENGFYVEITTVNPKCFGEPSGTLDINVQGGIGGVIYLLNGITMDPTNLSLAAGQYVLTVIDGNICSIDLSFFISEPAELVIDAMVYIPGLEHVEVTASGGIEPYMYSFDGGITFSDDNTFADFIDGVVQVIVQDSNGCLVEGITFIDGVDDLAVIWGINAYPNPFQEEILLELDFPTTVVASIEVFDISGRLVHNIPSQKYNSGNNFVKLNLSNFASSIYIVKIASAEGYRYIKVTKM
jgi:hypothetical protein